ncbi:MAG: ADP-ribosylation factor-like protein [Promethearchaeota archaeon]|jgi:small GTP-binding protein
MEDESVIDEDRLEFHDYYKFRVSYITHKSVNLFVLFVTGLTDKFDNIRKELVRCRREFINLFEEILQHRFDSKTFEVFDPIVDTIHKNLRPKISLVGFSGVGKTTITKLIRAEEIPMQHIPTITGDIATVRIGKLHFHLWDFAGQEQFSYLWNNFIKGSDAVLLITESTLENVEKSKFFLELIKVESPHAHTAIIGNKQDLKGAIKPAQIERMLGLKAYSMIAKDPGNRDKMIQIIADILEMSAEVSPLLKPLLERDKLIEEATKALKSADFEKAAFLFDKISYLCIELGDDSLGKEFFEKSQKIKSMLEQVGVPQPTPAFPIDTDRSEKSKSLEVQEEEILPQPHISTETPDRSKLTPPKMPPLSSTPTQTLDQTKTMSSDVQSATSKDWIKSSKGIPEKIITKEPQIESKKVGLQLNPEDFLVKLRPKTIGAIPRDAKSKLKTSAYGHVKNVAQQKKEEIPVQTQLQRSISIEIDEEASKIKPPSRPSDLFKEESLPKSSQPKQTHEIVKLPEAPKAPIPEIIPEEKSITPSPILTQESVEPPETPKAPIPENIPEEIPITPPPIPTQEPVESSQVIKTTIPEPVTQEKIKNAEVPLSVDKKQADHVKKTLIELKLKRADLYKMALDFDMKELRGEISPEELEEKKKKLDEYKKRIDDQIRELIDLTEE